MSGNGDAPRKFFGHPSSELFSGLQAESALPPSSASAMHRMSAEQVPRSTSGGADVYRSLATLAVGSAERATPRSAAAVAPPAFGGLGVGATVVKASPSISKKASADPDVAPPPPVYRLEPHTVSYVKGHSANHLVEAVTVVFARNHVDALFTRSNRDWRWDGVAYDSAHRATEVTASLFRGSSTDETSAVHVLEIRRVQGCAAFFHALKTALDNSLIDAELLCDRRGELIKQRYPPVATSVAEFGPLPLAYASLDESSTVARLDYDALTQACDSEYLDVKCEGLSCLAKRVHKDAECRQTLADDAPFVQKLKSYASSVDAEVRRLGVTVLDALTQERPNEVADDSLVKRLVATVAAGCRSPSEMEEKRVSASVLTHLVTSFKGTIKDQGGVEALKRVAEKSECGRLRGFCADLVAKLEATDDE